MKLHSQRFAVPSFPLRLITLAVLAFCSGQVLAVEPFTVRDIRVEGIQRTEAGTVFSYLPVRVGETFTDEKGAAAIKALYATGFFKDIRIEAEGDVLVVLVEERPAIAAVEFTGAKEFDKDQLTKALKEIGLGEARIYDKSIAERAEQELKRQYLSKGLYGVSIVTTVTPVERNRVNVTFAVDEGEVSRIRQITLVGNKVFSDKELRKAISLSTPGLLTWYTKADQYSKQKLAGDIETLKSYYLNRGYLEMQVESTQVSITPDKKDIYITINLSEGEKYTVSGVKLEGETFGRESELKSLVLLKAGDVYNGELLAESTKRISERMGNFGYAFANVNTNPELNREKKEVAFTILIDPGMGREAFLTCVERSQPTALVGVPLAHVARLRYRQAFRSVTHPITVGQRWFWGGHTLRGIASALNHRESRTRAGSAWQLEHVARIVNYGEAARV